MNLIGIKFKVGIHDFRGRQKSIIYNIPSTARYDPPVTKYNIHLVSDTIKQQPEDPYDRVDPVRSIVENAIFAPMTSTINI